MPAGEFPETERFRPLEYYLRAFGLNLEQRYVMEIFDLVGPNRAVSVFGVKLVGFTAENGRKLLLTITLLFIVWLLGRLSKLIVRRLFRKRSDARAQFWSNQAINILSTIFFLIGFVSVWFDDPGRLTTAFGLVSAGLAFALQRWVTSIAGYFIILRGQLFNVGDRISMGGVRGDVIKLTFTHTTVMEMGQPPSVQMADPAMWVEARQYTGRVVSITNDRIFDNPVYNYTREFPYLWEEMHVMIKYTADYHAAEKVLIDAATRHTVALSEMGADALRDMQQRYFVRGNDLGPRVYYRITDNWLELTVRFIVRDYGIRETKDAMAREIVDQLKKSGIEVASATQDIVGMPPLRIENWSGPAIK